MNDTQLEQQVKTYEVLNNQLAEQVQALLARVVKLEKDVKRIDYKVFGYHQTVFVPDKKNKTLG